MKGREKKGRRREVNEGGREREEGRSGRGKGEEIERGRIVRKGPTTLLKKRQFQ